MKTETVPGKSVKFTTFELNKKTRRSPNRVLEAGRQLHEAWKKANPQQGKEAKEASKKISEATRAEEAVERFVNSPFLIIDEIVESICLEAHRITNNDRRDEYGHPLDNFTQISKFWSEIIKTPITPEQVALCMAALKIVRLIHNPAHRDGIVDLAGYANCLDMIRQEKQRRASNVGSKP